MFRKDTWMRATSTTVMIIFSRVSFWNLLDDNYVHSSFLTITKHIDNDTLKDTLQLQILRTWIKIRINSLMKTWVNVMKWKSTKMSQKLSLEKKKKKKTNGPTLERMLHQIDISLIVILFFFFKTKLVFKSNPVLVNILDIFVIVNLHSNLLIIVVFFYFKVYLVPLHLFLKKQ